MLIGMRLIGVRHVRHHSFTFVSAQCIRAGHSNTQGAQGRPRAGTARVDEGVVIRPPLPCWDVFPDGPTTEMAV